MEPPINDYLAEILEHVRPDTSGERASYIEALAIADPEQLGIAMTTVSGRTYVAGDTESEFTIQSMSKPFAYAAALWEHGEAEVEKIVGIEPSGEAFDELSLESETHRPKNPMINVGALAIHQMIGSPGDSWEVRRDLVLQFFSRLAGRQLRVDEQLFESEMETAHRNLAIAHMLAAYDMIDTDPEDVVTGYTAQCSILVSTRDIAMMAAVLASGGVNPTTGQRVVERKIVRQVLSVMATAGMYDEAGEWFTEVGIPAKSGVSGGILGALPGQVGLAAFSPRLNEHGNSVRGTALFRRLSNDMGMHLMDAELIGARAVRGIHAHNGRSIVELQGPINFTAAEIIVNRLMKIPSDGSAVVFDVSRVGMVNEIGRKMVLEAMRRLRSDGHTIFLRDPEGVLPNPDMGDGEFPTAISQC